MFNFYSRLSMIIYVIVWCIVGWFVILSDGSIYIFSFLAFWTFCGTAFTDTVTEKNWSENKAMLIYFLILAVVSVIGYIFW